MTESVVAPEQAPAVEAAGREAIVSLSKNGFGWATFAVLILVLGIGAALRFFDFPQGNQIRDVDEIGYLDGGPQLMEGISPGMKAAPAGPQFWAEWAYVAVQATRRLIGPGPIQQKPWQVRPFFAVDDAIFDVYHDLGPLHRYVLIINNGLALLGCAAAVGLGAAYAGSAGGLLVGGLFAAWPLFVSFSDQSRPYAGAWAFAVIALCLVAIGQPKRCSLAWPAIFLGLAIGSRIDMLAILPLFWWISVDRRPIGGRIAPIILASLLSIAVAIFVAPWLATSLLGELRTIMTVRFSAFPFGPTPWTTTAIDFFCQQGAIAATLIAFAALCIQPGRRRLWCAVLAFYWFIVLASLLKERGFGLHQHAEVFLSLMVLLASTLPAVLARWPRFTWLAVLIAVATPAALSLRKIATDRDADFSEDSANWIEQHLPAGTTVYQTSATLCSLLPTPQSAQSLWNEVTGEEAWQKKFRSGLTRFQLQEGHLPRALSEENLVQERGSRRGWFILGGHAELPIPRYDIRLVQQSPVFGVHDLAAALQKQGGVIIWRTSDPPLPSQVGLPLIKWTSRNGSGIYIFCTPDVRDLLHL